MSGDSENWSEKHVNKRKTSCISKVSTKSSLHHSFRWSWVWTSSPEAPTFFFQHSHNLRQERNLKADFFQMEICCFVSFVCVGLRPVQCDPLPHTQTAGEKQQLPHDTEGKSGLRKWQFCLNWSFADFSLSWCLLSRDNKAHFSRSLRNVCLLFFFYTNNLSQKTSFVSATTRW